MTIEEFLKFRDVLDDPDRYDYGPYILFLPKGEDWSPDTKCLLMEPLDIPFEELKHEDDDIPPIALKHGLIPTLDIGTIEDIRAGVDYYLRDPTDKQLVEAFVHFYVNDAYKDFGDISDTGNV